MTVIQAANNGGERRENDFYPTPVECTLALLPKITDFPKDVWEPACGDGGIGRPLESGGFQVFGTDLVYRGYGVGLVDFLTTTRLRAPAIITNPPFGTLAHSFVEHAIDLRASHIAMLFNINFWSAAVRTPLWNRRPPDVVLALNWKPDFTGAGRPYFNCVWVVWRPGTVATRYERLARPVATLESLA